MALLKGNGDYISTKKGIKHASADVGLMFVAYNLRRIINIIGKDRFKKFLAELVSVFLPKMIVLKPYNAIIKHWNFTNLFRTYFFKAA